MENILTLNLPISIRQLSLKQNSKVFWIFFSILIITLVFLYIFQVNSLISESHSLEKFEKKSDTLNRENKNLEIEFSQVNSLANVETLIKEFNFEKVDKIYYIRVLESSIATK